MIDKLTERQMDIAIEWWADRVCKPKFDGLTEQERQDPANDAYKFAEGLALLLVEPVTDEQRERFKNALREEMQSSEFLSNPVLRIDYHPNQVLAKAAEQAGISENNFPWKTWMHFWNDGAVECATGYAAPVEVLR